MALVNCGPPIDFGAIILPSLELLDGVPPNLRTIIVIPTLLTSEVAIAEQVERLEVHYLANPDEDLCFALLSDWMDSADESVPGDDELLSAAVEGIANLNRRYGPTPYGDRFVLLHRRRLWDEGQGKWIGWERKRGKLHELNRLLRGATDTTFVPAGGHSVRALRHPLCHHPRCRHAPSAGSRQTPDREDGSPAEPPDARPSHRARASTGMPCFSRGSRRHCRPVVTVRCTSASSRACVAWTPMRSPFRTSTRTFSVKVRIAERESTMWISSKRLSQAAFPRIRSSATIFFEGIFARAGLVSDIEVVEDFPARYDVAAARQHRWARGDWQLLPWIIGRERTSNGDSTPAGDPARSADGR